MNLEVASKSTFGLARDWLDKCLNGKPPHEKCKRATVAYLPKRLVEIDVKSENPSLRLRDTVYPASTTAELYVALSYCWGGEQDCKTTKATLPDRYVGIPWASLPKTIQDAVTVTRELGIRFLWVDSLCIVQDDEDDKETQIPEMAQVYGSSTVTIAASRSSCVHNGFLSDRDPVSLLQEIFKLPYHCPDGSLGSVLLSNDEADTDVDPLHTRGWALQERILSPRFLDYGSRQLRWMCSGTFDPQAGTISDDSRTDGWLPEARFSSRSVYSFSTKTLMSGDKKTLISEWAQIIEEYTSRDLTDPKDRLRGICGIATEFGKALRDEKYLSGIWSFKLPASLLWRVSQTSTRNFDPSWSWGSLNMPVTFDELLTDPCTEIPDPDIEIIGWDAGTEDSSRAHRAHVQANATITRITVRGRLVQAGWCGTDSVYVRQPSSEVPLAGEADISKDAFDLRILPDEDTERILSPASKPIEIYLLRIYARGYSAPWARLTGLILRKAESSLFTRFGIFEGLSDRGASKDLPVEFGKHITNDKRLDQRFDNCKVQTLTIV